MAHYHFLFALLIASLDRASAGLRISIFNNTVSAPPAIATQVVSTPTFTHAGSEPFSATITGTLEADPGYTYGFNCNVGAAAFAFLKIDGHLVCQVGANNDWTPSAGEAFYVYDSPLPVLTRTSWAFRLTFLYNRTGASLPDVTFGVKLLRNATKAPRAPSSKKWPDAHLLPDLSAEEIEREALQAETSRGWASWYDMSYTKLVRLPEGSTLTVALCEPPTPGSGEALESGEARPPDVGAMVGAGTRCVLEARTDWAPSGSSDVVLRPGAHAVDRSYARLHVATATCNVSLTMGGGERLQLLAEVADGCAAGHELVLIGGSAWYRLHQVRAAADRLTFTPYGTGVRASTLFLSSDNLANGSLPLPDAVASHPHLAIPLRGGAGDGSVALASDGRRSVAAVRASLEAAWQAEQARYSKFGDLAETKMAVQAGVMWSVVYNPFELGPVAPVIRGNPWAWDPSPVNDDWPFVLFDWDTHFAAYMLSLDTKALGYSALMQIIKAKTPDGFVANGYAPSRKSTHSQPPVGSRVLLEMYRRHADSWLITLLIDDLIDWSDWFWANRRLAPLGITALGGDSMQAGRFESGLDDSPMYDGDFFVGDPFGLMQMYDVGMASMVAMSDDALAELAEAINRTDVASTMRRRADEARGKIAAHLWDEAIGIFANRFPDGTHNGTFNPRITPTSFYPMMAGAASDERAAAMMSHWMLNATRFCLTPRGDFAGNSNECDWPTAFNTHSMTTR